MHGLCLGDLSINLFALKKFILYIISVESISCTTNPETSKFSYDHLVIKSDIYRLCIL